MVADMNVEVSPPEKKNSSPTLGNTKQCLYVCLWDRDRYKFPQWYTLWINPNNRNQIKKRKKRNEKRTIRQLMVPIPSSNFPSTANPIVVGSEIYVIGGPIGNSTSEPSSAVCVLDCRTHTWRDAPSMNVAREHAATCVYDGKIYVIGGVKVNESESSFAEVFDTRTQTWECLPDPSGEVRKNEICRIAEMEGKINFGNSSKMYAYDIKKGEWESCVNIVATFARSACVIENESYYFGKRIFSYVFKWSDVNGGHLKEVKGVDLLEDVYMKNGGSSNNTTKRACCGGKFYVMWEGNVRRNCDDKKKIWCAEISVEKRDGCEIWGNMEWVDVVHTVPKSCKLMHFLAASV